MEVFKTVNFVLLISSFLGACSSSTSTSKTREIASTSLEDDPVVKLNFLNNIQFDLNQSGGKKLNDACKIDADMKEIYTKLREKDGEVKFNSLFGSYIYSDDMRDYTDRSLFKRNPNTHRMFRGKKINLEPNVDYYLDTRDHSQPNYFVPKNQIISARSSKIILNRYEMQGIEYEANFSFFYPAEKILAGTGIEERIKKTFDAVQKAAPSNNILTPVNYYIRVNFSCQSPLLERGVLSVSDDDFSEKQRKFKEDFKESVESITDMFLIDGEKPLGSH